MAVLAISKETGECQVRPAQGQDRVGTARHMAGLGIHRPVAGPNATEVMR